MMTNMRTTIRLDDDIARTVKQLAHKEDVSFGLMLNRVLRAGLAAGKGPKRSKKRFQQRTFAMGQPAFDVDQALAFAAALDDEETLRKVELRK